MSCSYGDTFNYIPDNTYACGVEIPIVRPNQTNIPFPIPDLVTCCNKANSTVHRIPGNTGCEIQWCVVPMVNQSALGQDSYPNSFGPDERIAHDCIWLINSTSYGGNVSDISRFCSLQTFTLGTDGFPEKSTTSSYNPWASWSSVVNQCYTDPGTWPVPVDPTPCSSSEPESTITAAPVAGINTGATARPSSTTSLATASSPRSSRILFIAASVIMFYGLLSP